MGASGLRYGKWLTRQQVTDIPGVNRSALSGLPMPTGRLEAFDNCREPGAVPGLAE